MLDYYYIIAKYNISIEWRGKVVWVSLRPTPEDAPIEVYVEYPKAGSHLEALSKAIDDLLELLDV